jgi:hypothetical protein
VLFDQKHLMFSRQASCGSGARRSRSNHQHIDAHGKARTMLRISGLLGHSGTPKADVRHIGYIPASTKGMIVAVPREYDSELTGARDLVDIFEVVKSAVRDITGMQRSGLMLALANLGGGMEGFVGAFYPIATNIIVMNSLPLRRIKETDPGLYKPYVFHILLHEYLHALGIIDEGAVREKARQISEQTFGRAHSVTQFAVDLSRFVPKLVYPVYGWRPAKEYSLELVKGFDRSSADPYIS